MKKNKVPRTLVEKRLVRIMEGCVFKIQSGELKINFDAGSDVTVPSMTFDLTLEQLYNLSKTVSRKGLIFYSNDKLFLWCKERNGLEYDLTFDILTGIARRVMKHGQTVKLELHNFAENKVVQVRRTGSVFQGTLESLVIHATLTRRSNKIERKQDRAMRELLSTIL